MAQQGLTHSLWLFAKQQGALLLEAMRPYLFALAPLQTWWQARSSQEKRTLTLGAAVVVVYVLWQVVDSMITGYLSLSRNLPKWRADAILSGFYEQALRGHDKKFNPNNQKIDRNTDGVEQGEANVLVIIQQATALLAASQMATPSTPSPPSGQKPDKKNNTNSPTSAQINAALAAAQQKEITPKTTLTLIGEPQAIQINNKTAYTVPIHGVLWDNLIRWLITLDKKNIRIGDTQLTIDANGIVTGSVVVGP